MPKFGYRQLKFNTCDVDNAKEETYKRLRGRVCASREAILSGGKLYHEGITLNRSRQSDY